MLYTVKLTDNKNDLIFSFEDVTEMDTFLKLYFKSRNEILIVEIYVDGTK